METSLLELAVGLDVESKGKKEIKTDFYAFLLEELVGWLCN